LVRAFSFDISRLVDSVRGIEGKLWCDHRRLSVCMRLSFSPLAEQTALAVLRWAQKRFTILPDQHFFNAK
jgi:hypothetical protein